MMAVKDEKKDNRMTGQENVRRERSWEPRCSLALEKQPPEALAAGELDIRQSDGHLQS